MDLRRSRIAVLAAGGMAVAALVSGCGSGTGYSASGEYSPGGYQPPADAGDASSAAPKAGKAKGKLVVLKKAMAGDLGWIVTDGRGFTLYRFDKDVAKPPTSNCDRDCQEMWPPVLAGRVNAKGVPADLVGRIKRPDGTWQLTISGWPMYRFSGDDKPGDVNGQSVDDLWWATAPSGKKVTGAADSSDDGGYDY